MPPDSGNGRDTETRSRRSASSEMDETRLIRMITAGDRHAFDSLYRIYFPRLHRFLNRMMRSAAAIEEITNDTMLVVWNKAGSYDASCKVSTWIFAIAYRTALKAMKYLDEPLEFDESLCAGEETNEPENTFSLRQLQQEVAHAVGALPFEQRIVVSLTYFHGADYNEIAQIIACPLNTVKTRMFLARKRLKAMLAEQWGEN